MTSLPPGLQPLSQESAIQETQPIQSQSDSKISDMDRFGLGGLLGLIRMEDSEQTSVALGTDINNFNFNLNSYGIPSLKESGDAKDTKDKKTKLSRFFASPWEETSRSEVEPSFSIPSSFILPNSEILGTPESKINTFSDETLFFIFYTRPKDMLQEIAARELIARNWRYHKEIQVWLTKDSNVEPVIITPNSEKGVYIFFDPHNWEKIKKEFVLNYHAVM